MAVLVNGHVKCVVLDRASKDKLVVAVPTVNAIVGLCRGFVAKRLVENEFVVARAKLNPLNFAFTLIPVVHSLKHLGIGNVVPSCVIDSHPAARAVLVDNPLVDSCDERPGRKFETLCARKGQGCAIEFERLVYVRPTNILDRDASEIRKIAATI